MSHHEEEKENDMKKRLIIALALCVLILSACGTVLGTRTSSNNPVAHSTAPIAAASTQTACSILQERQVYLQQATNVARAQLSAAHGDLRKAEAAEKQLIKLHELNTLVQAQLNKC